MEVMRVLADAYRQWTGCREGCEIGQTDRRRDRVVRRRSANLDQVALRLLSGQSIGSRAGRPLVRMEIGAGRMPRKRLPPVIRWKVTRKVHKSGRRARAARVEHPLADVNRNESPVQPLQSHNDGF
jgi:hypothetical protein